jgi:hypothetical protein
MSLEIIRQERISGGNIGMRDKVKKEKIIGIKKG